MPKHAYSLSLRLRVTIACEAARTIACVAARTIACVAARIISQNAVNAKCVPKSISSCVHTQSTGLIIYTR